MPTRSGDGFSFPIRKFDDGAGLFTNFKYLEQWLKGLGQGGASYAYVTIDSAGQDNWVAGYVEWSRDAAAVVVDPDGIISSVGGTNGRDIFVVPGTYIVTGVLNLNGAVNTTTFEYSNYYTAVSLFDNNFVVQAAHSSPYMLISSAQTTIELQASLTNSFVVTDGQWFRFESSPWAGGQSDNFAANTDNWFLEPHTPPDTFPGTHITFLKVA